MSKNVVETENPYTIWRMHVACWIIKATRAQARARAPTPTHLPPPPHTQSNTYCFPTATIVPRTRLIVPLGVHCLSLHTCMDHNPVFARGQPQASMAVSGGVRHVRGPT
jgi:hypothetical protein